MIDPLVDRIARRQAADRARAQRLRALIPVVASVLRARGATRVVLFGSLATGAEPHAASDVDLAIVGLSDDAIADATLEIEAITGAKVDLVGLETASPSLVRRIAEDGIEVPRVAD